MTHVLGITGHRPDSLGGYSQWPSNEPRAIRIAEAFLRMWRPDAIALGLAQGWDTACALAAMRLGIPFDAYIPFEGQESRWPGPAQEQYRLLRAQARTVDVGTDGSYQSRNVKIVNASSAMLALWNGMPSGTANCIDYATRRIATPRPVVNLWRIWE